MSFNLPTFNITCNIYTGPWSSKVLRISEQACNLQFGRRFARFNDFPIENESSQMMSLLLPPGTDIRSTAQGYSLDSVEVPSGSGRIYAVLSVDDVGKGFDNEFRVATIVQASEPKFGTGSDYNGLFWPTPMP
jgi:hypothetical protein